MKIENERYVLAKKNNNENMYISEEYGLVNDIREALKIRNIITAQNLRHEIEVNYNLHLDIVPLKIVYMFDY